MPVEHLDPLPATDLSVPVGTALGEAPVSAPASVNAPPPRVGVHAVSDRSQMYGSFWIGNTEFALPVTAIREVVNEPDRYSPVPLSPPHMLGLFSLRGLIIPIIDLRVLLGFSTLDNPPTRKLAIMENGEHCLGLIFDDTGGMINAEGAARVNFDANDDGVKDVVIEGVLKLDDGSRLVQILDPYKILNIERLPKVAKTSGDQSEKYNVGQRLTFISFQIGHTKCAIDLRYVQEITDMPKVQKSQLAHGHLIGNVDLRGLTIPVIDFRGFIGNEAPYQFSPESLQARKLLILSLPDGQVGLLVYSIDSIIPSFEGDLLPFANIALPRHDIVAGCLINDDSDIIIILDHDILMRDKDLVNAARSCQEIYPPQQDTGNDSKEATVLTRETYILFSVEIGLALDISCVSEIINRPETLLKPPYVLDFVEGILNLRGELITLIDPRKLYNFPSTESPGTKILIFQKDSKKYGMVVDSVDEIVTTNHSHYLELPEIGTDDVKRKVSKDVFGCLNIPTRDLASDPVMVLNVEALLRRCVEAENG